MQCEVLALAFLYISAHVDMGIDGLLNGLCSMNYIKLWAVLNYIIAVFKFLRELEGSNTHVSICPTVLYDLHLNHLPYFQAPQSNLPQTSYH